MLSSVLGNDFLCDELHRRLLTGTVGHAYLFTAPEGAGRGYVARCFAADYLFPEGGPSAQAVMNGVSPEVLVLQGEGKSGKIPVENVRRVRSALYHSSLSSAFGRVVLIRHAGRMAPAASNALLKALEEPPEGVVFLLCASEASDLPLTVLSRCQWFPVAPLSSSLCQQELCRRQPDSCNSPWPHLLSVVLAGRLGSGLHALRDPSVLAVFEQALSLLTYVGGKQFYRILTLFSAFEGRAEGEGARRELFLSFVSDCLLSSMRQIQLPGYTLLPPVLAATILSSVLETRQNLLGNVSPKIAFTSLAVSIRADMQTL